MRRVSEIKEKPTRRRGRRRGRRRAAWIEDTRVERRGHLRATRCVGGKRSGHKLVEGGCDDGESARQRMKLMRAQRSLCWPLPRPDRQNGDDSDELACQLKRMRRTRTTVGISSVCCKSWPPAKFRFRPQSRSRSRLTPSSCLATSSRLICHFFILLILILLTDRRKTASSEPLEAAKCRQAFPPTTIDSSGLTRSFQPLSFASTATTTTTTFHQDKNIDNSISSPRRRTTTATKKARFQQQLLAGQNVSTSTGNSSNFTGESCGVVLFCFEAQEKSLKSAHNFVFSFTF